MKTLLSLFFSLFVSFLVYGQCAIGGRFCEYAAPIPCSGLSGTLDDVPPDGANFPGCPSNTLDNPHWYSFTVQQSGNFVININSSNCQG
ncbi:MAG: hypothetical protein AAGH79_19000, partial [Bacteroidota bacterium]